MGAGDALQGMQEPRRVQLPGERFVHVSFIAAGARGGARGGATAGAKGVKAEATKMPPDSFYSHREVAVACRAQVVEGALADFATKSRMLITVNVV